VSDADPQDLGLLPKLVIVFAVALIAAGVAWHGITFGVIERIWRNLFERSSGPLSFRFILQPSMAAIAAILDSVKTIRSGHVPYFWTFAHSPDKRVALLREGKRNRQDHPSRARNGFDIPAYSLRYIPSGRGAYHRRSASLCSLLGGSRPVHTYRAPVTRRCVCRRDPVKGAKTCQWQPTQCRAA
jgi:hypothetical protein